MTVDALLFTLSVILIYNYFMPVPSIFLLIVVAIFDSLSVRPSVRPSCQYVRDIM